jgi:hypothetical protein
MRLPSFNERYIVFYISKCAVRKTCNRFSFLNGVVGDIFRLPYKRRKCFRDI